MRELTCDEVHDAAAPFALDILDPTRRSRVNAHLTGCRTCRDDLTAMQRSAAELLDLPPVLPRHDAAPDAYRYPFRAEGKTFEAGDLDFAADWGHRGSRRPPRRRLRLVTALAAAAALMVGSALGPELERSAPAPGPLALASATLMQSGRPVGGVYFYAGSAPSMAVEVGGMPSDGRLACEALARDGSVLRLGQFRVYGGHGAWATSQRVDLNRISGIVLVDDQGHVAAAATLPAPVTA